MLNGSPNIGPLAKLLLIAVAVLMVGWMSFISYSHFELRKDVYTHVATLGNSISSMASDIRWIKNEAQKGKRFTAEDGARHELQIEKIEKCCEKMREKVIRLER